MRYDISKNKAPEMPNLGKGTECIKLLLSQASKDMHEPLVPMFFPSLGAHISGAEFQYPDLTWKEMCGQMANLVADSGCNKGQLSHLVEAICHDFTEHDEAELKKLVEWQKQGTPWLQIPYYDRSGRLTGVQNRNLIRGALPRFRFPSGSKCGIYNLPVLNLLKPGEPLFITEGGEPLFITEGSSDCWAMLSAGHKAIAIPSATLLTRQDIEMLSSLPSQPGGDGGGFHMFPDRDAPGERLFLQLQKVLPTLQHHQLPPDCKDFSDYYLTHLRKPP